MYVRISDVITYFDDNNLKKIKAKVVDFRRGELVINWCEGENSILPVDRFKIEVLPFEQTPFTLEPTKQKIMVQRAPAKSRQSIEQLRNMHLQKVSNVPEIYEKCLAHPRVKVWELGWLCIHGLI